MSAEANREQWLHQATEWFRPWFESAGAKIPQTVRVSVGFPSRGAVSAKSRTLGQCWDATASADGVHQVFVSPVLEDTTRAAATLAHELVHAAVGTSEGHKGAFKRIAKAIGLEGKMKSTHAGEKLTAAIVAMAEEIGPFPHAPLTPTVGVKKQSTRMVKAECECGMVVRTTRKWIDEVGLPQCRCGGSFEEAIA